MVSKTDCAYRCLEQHCSEKQFFQESGEGKKKGLAIKLIYLFKCGEREDWSFNLMSNRYLRSMYFTYEYPPSFAGSKGLAC